MTAAVSYACRDCEGMETCPATVTAETRAELWELIGLHARIAHGEDPAVWDRETRDYLETLIKEVDVPTARA